MLLNLHGMQYGLSQHYKILQDVGVGLVMYLTIKMHRKMPRFTLCSVVLTTALACIED